MRLAPAVFLGGTVGTALRLATDQALPHSADQFPVSTLVVNAIGAFVLGWLVAGLWTRPAVPQWLKATLGPGLLGSFTTFSAVMVSLVGLVSADFRALAAAYLAATLVLGFAAAALGLWLGTRLAHRPAGPAATDAGGTP
ncbi:fluoride efflux transporter FluC [Cryobacterium fucosi]|uniref:Fluoride-specific ion channel FluC n=1 Tax=Cryobacterium fucosi TaxID=1259157 RepID=A0A4R9BBP0_9MICO|nr:CrcB family protein [Cryobacterium fucosi]TFD80046.1 CrcB family protein [Cryobacterium fucosi]